MNRNGISISLTFLSLSGKFHLMMFNAAKPEKLLLSGTKVCVWNYSHHKKKVINLILSDLDRQYQVVTGCNSLGPICQKNWDSAFFFVLDQNYVPHQTQTKPTQTIPLDTKPSHAIKTKLYIRKKRHHMRN